MSADRGPLIVDIKRNSLDDGPGIRSVVFFKGCPLRCQWCQNPEAMSPLAQLQREPERCAGCGACQARCPERVARAAGEPEPRRASCRACGACVEACPIAARRIAGQHHRLEELIELLLQDEPFYRRSGGGVTLSGGEPAVHARWVGALAAALADRGVHLLVETSGQFAWPAFERELLPHLSAIYFDLKLGDDEAHRRFTGHGNERIRANLARLAHLAAPELLPRVPLIPGITDGRDNLEALAALLVDLDLPTVALLSYNPLWVDKRRALGLELPYARRDWMPSAEVDRCAEVFREAGLAVI